MEKEIKVTPFYFDNVLAKQYKVIIQIGGRFSSKSYNSQIELAGNLMSKKNYTLLVIEDLETNMKDGYYAGLKDKIEQFEHESAYNMTKSPVEITNNLNKNKALFKGYSSDQQKKAVKALDQITEILVEEGEWLRYDDFVGLLHQLRGGDPKDRKLSILMNPVDDECFVNQMFIQEPPDKVIEYFPNSRRPKVFEKNIVTTFEFEGKTVTDITTVLIVLSTHHDNNYLTLAQRATIEKLRETDPEKYKQLGEARFIRPGGAHFKEFSEEIHVCKSFEIPAHWDRYSTIDYGLDMLAGLWIAVDERGKGYVYKDTNEPDLIIKKAASKLHEINNNERLAIRYGPGDLWNRRQETGKSVYDWFVEHRWYMVKSDRDRANGAMAMKEWLNPYMTKDIVTGEEYMTADLQIFDTCTLLIKHLKAVLTDEKDPNKYANEPHGITHNLDALRYFCIMRTSPSAAREKAKKPRGSTFEVEKPIDPMQVEYSDAYINYF